MAYINNIYYYYIFLRKWVCNSATLNSVKCDLKKLFGQGYRWIYNLGYLIHEAFTRRTHM